MSEWGQEPKLSFIDKLFIIIGAIVVVGGLLVGMALANPGDRPLVNLEQHHSQYKKMVLVTEEQRKIFKQSILPFVQAFMYFHYDVAWNLMEGALKSPPNNFRSKKEFVMHFEQYDSGMDFQSNGSHHAPTIERHLVQCYVSRGDNLDPGVEAFLVNNVYRVVTDEGHGDRLDCLRLEVLRFITENGKVVAYYPAGNTNLQINGGCKYMSRREVIEARAKKEAGQKGLAEK